MGDHPLANSLLSNPNDPEQKYPLSLSWCQDCSLVQLNETVDPKVLFSQYVWVTGTSQGAREYAEVFCKELLERIELSAGDFVLEIASNDGTFLKPFRARGITVVGIDPAENIIKTANEDGIPTEPVFWGVESAHVLRKNMGGRVLFLRATYCLMSPIRKTLFARLLTRSLRMGLLPSRFIMPDHPERVTLRLHLS